MEESEYKSRKENSSGKKRSHGDQEGPLSERVSSRADYDDKHRDRDREKRKDKERSKCRADDRARGRTRDKKRDGNKEERDRDRGTRDVMRRREREREKREQERERGRERRERKRDREKDLEIEKERDRAGEREKLHKYAIDEKDDHIRGWDRKRCRTDNDDCMDHHNRDCQFEQNGFRLGKHREDRENASPKRRNCEDVPDKKESTREEDLAEEQRKLDEDMDKRRRRVEEWQQLKRIREKAETEKLGLDANLDAHKSGKNWTLEGESDDEESATEGKTGMDVDANEVPKLMDEDGDCIAVDNENGTSRSGICGSGTDDKIDPLDAFMNSVILPEVEKLNNVIPPASVCMDTYWNDNKEPPKKGVNKSMERIIPGEDSDSSYEDLEDEENPLEDEDDEELMKRVKKTKAEKLSIVDHSKVDYPPFRKNLYIEVKEISRMTAEEVAAYRRQLELKIHGKEVPKPVKSWHQTALSTKVLDVIKKLHFEKPTPIQAQALPIIMSGRDCIGIAKTGSGKTLAFVLPMLRHIKDQPPLMPGDGPIGLIMAPTRELVQQIHTHIKKFAKAVGIRCVPVYGGVDVSNQRGELKQGAEIVVCSPGRMIDMLCMNGGKVTNLRRVTYLVLDEADRMFDMGFEPQITRIIQNTRPERQTVLFSATFPRQVEILARKVLKMPIEIQAGGRSVVNKDITQLVEVRPKGDRLLRLLELLGEWYEKGKILIFVHTQENCDVLFKDLLKHSYPCLSLHGAKEQTDRESTISDFKSNVCNLLIATSVAARGLDVKELELVINFDVPNHYEDYVHRVGRTGRAGRKGCAITFISDDDDRYAPDLVKALELSEQVVPDDLKALADSFMAKVNQGLEQAHGTGYGGSGFKFNEEEDEARKAAKKAQAKEYGFEEEYKSDSEDEDEIVRKTNELTIPSPRTGTLNVSVHVTLSVASGITIPGIPAIQGEPQIGPTDAAARAQALAAAMNLHQNLAKIQANAMPEHYEAELEINDFPQNARWRVTHKETLGPISEWTGAAITTRGQYFSQGKSPGPGERKLYLFIEGPTEQSVKRAKAELKRVLEDITMQASSLPGSAQPGRYQVL